MKDNGTDYEEIIVSIPHFFEKKGRRKREEKERERERKREKKRKKNYTIILVILFDYESVE